ncbi:TlpA family protein disulfide reductase [Hymenobacter sp. RP-2-7]|uniref:TlpA family protein disulfide reductase n=1 Tax=Hymenobacter polaris TaxID=2682546 RepID=A0A7Y0AC11_9BACT|nr:TlpA disulfide reductase family protein [Hymenobacter polaris]NML64586.1 TlpA family protein disulfide reductase [Hymenobacter polaris]
MMRVFALMSLLVVSLTAAAQRPRVTKATVFTDADGTVLSRQAYRNKLQTNQFVTDKAQIANAVITSISLRPAPAPDSVRTQAVSPARAYLTPAPAFTLTDINGQSYSLAALRGKVVVLNFWFIKCGVCQQEMPALKQLASDYRANPAVVFISFARDEAERLRRYIASKGDFGFAVLPLPPALAQEFGIEGYPTTAVLDRSGRYTYDKEGYVGNLRYLRQAIEHALR